MSESITPENMSLHLELDLMKERANGMKLTDVDFSLPGCWPRENTPMFLPQGSGELVEPPDLPHLALII